MQIELQERDKLDERLLEIALQSLAAGEALPEAGFSRSVTSPTYKYGMHLGNWTDGGSGGLEREIKVTLPTSILFMDNVKGQPLQLQLERLAADGVKPILIYRPYFNPTGGNSAAVVAGYANGAAIRMRDEYLPHPLIGEAYEQGRFIIKLFNETNIGGEGVARGRAGFADALRMWKQARGIVKALYPKAKFMSIANTPGNDDMWFTGDATGQPYWYHGSEAAKANPSPSEIAAAIASCPFREMFELCDYIGIHVYAQDERQTRGDLQTWYSRRHEQALKFLGPYINAGKKMIISEADCGYDDIGGQSKRAELFTYWLANIVGTNDAILTVNHWWNSDDGEGAITWEKHQTRKGGEFRPIVRAVGEFRNGANIPPPDNPPPPPVPPTVERVRLRIPYASQLAPVAQADFGVGDCLQAVITQLARASGRTVTVNDVARLTGLPRGYLSSHIITHGVNVARQLGIRLLWAGRLEAEDLKEEIRAGRSVILRVWYPFLMKRFDLNYSQYHFITVHGFEGDTFFYDDPYWRKQSDGEDIAITAAQLRRAAWRAAGGSTPAQGLLVRSLELPKVEAA